MTETLTPGEARLRRQAAPEGDIAAATRTLVVGPYLTRAAERSASAGETPRSIEARLDEATGLAAAIELDVTQAISVQIQRIRPSTYLGKGRVEEIAGLIAAEEIGLVVADCALSPVQQRNLEKAWGAKVIDRTGLILEIFGRRASTREGTLQVEHAHLSYQKSRLVRSWTHLERQRGGFGFLGGPGETQIEADRRQIQERMTKIERDLDSVTRTRGLHRTSRARVPYPIVALVGYTNAGKSTLFNALTKAEVKAQDMLFATLDPTARATKLPHGETVILSDTVGFISDLPTSLIAAFRATLEDVIEADILLHVRDVSHGDTEAQREDVDTVLRELGIEANADRIIEVWNKADLLHEGERTRLANLGNQSGGAAPVLVSALTGEGLDALSARIEARIATARSTFAVKLGPEEGAALNWLYENAEVLDRKSEEGGTMHLAIRIAPEKEPRFLNRFEGARRIRSAAR
ncbi:GTPase HflX [Methylobacterium haplocladii]|uniref:GTPase HflX n=1 Tax=Methylobacterium haplocladii TaxID=1176176 RepID=A0A512ITC9_9HYPH|nr:GTPase HflX [Methylobacterium haplocladii]GEP00957.1 GTPase HflX [Methylobacterium haplocladii]GJD84913.1 GTPase HflX [Methylobacterium haplocladii]GLS58303.1 GTPase HflX [Methylobacterium haplocladii]